MKIKKIGIIRIKKWNNENKNRIIEIKNRKD